MKKLYGIIAILLILSLTTSAQPVKRVLFEQHTGAWCGWCVDGSHKLKQIVEEHPGLVIPVKLHYGTASNPDNMNIPVGSTIGDGLGLTGYPAGCIDRTQFGGTYFPNRYETPSNYSTNTWMPLVEERLALIPQVDLFATYNIDEEFDSIKIIVNATMLETVSGNLKFNVYILEDSVTGTGAGWDQHNYLAGRAGWEFSPYYSLPDVIPNYYHEHVVRDLLGGAWGVTGEFTDPAEEAAVYVHEFNAKLNPAWNKDMIQIVALVTNDDTKECLNVCYGDTKPPAPPVMELSSVSPDVGVLNDGDTFIKEYSVKNISEAEHQFQVTMNVSTATPSDWSAQLPTSEITVPAGQTGSFIVRLTAGPTVGWSEVKVSVNSLTDSEAPKTSGSFIGISGSIENFEVLNSKESANSILPFKTNETLYFNIGPKEFSKLSNKLPNINSVIWNLGDADKMASTDVAALSGLIDKGVDVLMLGYNSLSSLRDASYLDDLGLQYYGYSQEGYVDGMTDYACWLNGVANDPLTGSMATKILYLERNIKEIPVCKISDPTNTFPILVFRNPQTIYTSGTNTESVQGIDAMCGFRITKGDANVVIIGINPIGLMVETYRDNLINRPLELFAGTIDVDENNISTADFSVSISPNPVENFMTVTYSLNHNNPQYYSLSLFNDLGQEIVKIFDDFVSPGEHSIKQNVSGLPNGTYRLVLKNISNVQTVPVVIIR